MIRRINYISTKCIVHYKNYGLKALLFLCQRQMYVNTKQSNVTLETQAQVIKSHLWSDLLVQCHLHTALWRRLEARQTDRHINAVQTNAWKNVGHMICLKILNVALGNLENHVQRPNRWRSATLFSAHIWGVACKARQVRHFHFLLLLWKTKKKDPS